MDNRRTGNRTKLRSKLKLCHPDSGEVFCYTVDISDNGIGLEVGDWPIPAIGTKVTVQVQDMAVEAPILEMIVVRISKHSVGLTFVDFD